MFLFANMLVFAGATAIWLSLQKVLQLIKILPDGKMRKRWYMLGGLIVLFILGYVAQISFFWDSYVDWSAMMVPVIYFCGGVFVWAVCGLSLQTTVDLKIVLRENVTDSLTSIYNRRYLEQRLSEEVDRAVRYQAPLSVMMLDIDHFKSINDTWGHQAGDKILSEFRELIKSSVRVSDIVARYGGEEFLILAPSTDAEAAYNLAERIRENTEKHNFEINGSDLEKRSVSVTVSAGVAQLAAHGITGDQLVNFADEALYRAKHSGRNCVMLEEAYQALDSLV
jgi:diguanylate cyclase (GGDEF)-like protein